MKVLCVIPARYASTRLPGKPLALIAGKPMIQHVYMKLREANCLMMLLWPRIMRKFLKRFMVLVVERS